MPFFVQLAFVILLGFVIGSFISAYSYRLPRGIKITKGRSFCDKCKKVIAWYDNIPLLSYLLLRGKCRHCGKRISMRYPLIELSCALGFIALFLVNERCAATLPDTMRYLTLQGATFKGSVFCTWSSYLGSFSLAIFMFLFAILTSIFVIDLENNIIPDNLVFILYATIISALVLTHIDNFYLYLLTGFLSADFLLMLHFITKGKGMGLGDVKFALFAGTFLGWPNSATWLFLAFLTGAIVGSILILLGRAKLKSRVPFGPFLIISFFITLFFGNLISRLLI